MRFSHFAKSCEHKYKNFKHSDLRKATLLKNCLIKIEKEKTKSGIYCKLYCKGLDEETFFRIKDFIQYMDIQEKVDIINNFTNALKRGGFVDDCAYGFALDSFENLYWTEGCPAPVPV